MDLIIIIVPVVSAIVVSLFTYFNFRKNHRTKISTQKIGEVYEKFFSFVLEELLPKKEKDEELEEKMRCFRALFITWGDTKTLYCFIEFLELAKKIPENKELGPSENDLIIDRVADLFVSMRRGLGYKKISKVDIMSIIVNEEKEEIEKILNRAKSISVKSA